MSAAAALAVEGSRFQPAARSALGAVSTETAPASQAGVAVLRDGGNAVDAAVASLFAISVTAPHQCGLGGGVRILYRAASGRTAVIDAGARAPAATTPTTIGTTPSGIDSSPGIGHRVVAVPGAVAGLAEALDEFGTISLRRAIAPAEKLARDGFVVGADLAVFFDFFANQSPRLQRFPETAAIFLRPDLTPYPEGSLLVQRDLAKTLRAIAKDGPSAFYTGSVAKKIAAEFKKPAAYPGDESILTAKDLANYRPVDRRAITGRYRGARIISVPPPMYGADVIETLNILEGFPLSRFGHGSADAFHVRAEAQKIAEVDADSVVTDPAFSDVPTDTLISRDYAAERRTEISMTQAGVYTSRVADISDDDDDGSHTTSVAIIDKKGNAIDITCTLSSSFGSVVVAEGTGVLLNNSMTNFFPPGHPDQAEGNKMTATSIAPTIVVKDDKPLAALGAGGGGTIYRAIPEVISNMLDFGMDLAHAVDAERFHGHQDELGPYAFAEDARILPDVLAALQGRGHEVVDLFPPNPPRGVEYACCVEMAFVHAAGIDPQTGERLGVTDPRARDALAIGQ